MITKKRILSGRFFSSHFHLFIRLFIRQQTKETKKFRFASTPYSDKRTRIKLTKNR